MAIFQIAQKIKELNSFQQNYSLKVSWNLCCLDRFLWYSLKSNQFSINWFIDFLIHYQYLFQNFLLSTLHLVNWFLDIDYFDLNWSQFCYLHLNKQESSVFSIPWGWFLHLFELDFTFKRTAHQTYLERLAKFNWESYLFKRILWLPYPLS